MSCCGKNCQSKGAELREARQNGARRVRLSYATLEAITGIVLTVYGLEIEIDQSMKDGEVVTE